MSPALEGVFLAANGIAFIGWFVLVALPRWEQGRTVLAPVVVPGLLALMYVVMMAIGLPGSEGGFMSLAGVSKLLAKPVTLLGGWIHYLAFDLVVGAWEARDARAIGLPHGALVPCLLLTFVLGPAGLLVYVIVRGVAKKRLAV
jgi:hypothetical protein